MKAASLKRERQSLECRSLFQLQPIQRGLVCKSGFGSKNIHLAQNHPGQRRLIMFGEQRHQFVADAVSLDIQLRIGGILAESDPLLCRISFQDGFGLIEQWPREHNFWIARRRTLPFHARQPLATGAAQQAQKKKFHLIIRMMRQGNAPNLHLAGGRGKKVMTQKARRH
ncbi:MAG TPA: hypothetical protein VFC07_11520, partial [Verrucomicrobiae bacterium]|nr:hypothetical protein [Verrucomicrobiae bacterium]